MSATKSARDYFTAAKRDEVEKLISYWERKQDGKFEAIAECKRLLAELVVMVNQGLSPETVKTAIRHLDHKINIGIRGYSNEQRKPAERRKPPTPVEAEAPRQPEPEPAPEAQPATEEPTTRLPKAERDRILQETGEMETRYRARGWHCGSFPPEFYSRFAAQEWAKFSKRRLRQVREACDIADRCGRPEAASRSRGLLEQAEAIGRKDFGAGYLLSVASREAIGLENPGTFAAMATRQGYELPEFNETAEPEPTNPIVHFPTPQQLADTAKHEGAHAAVALWCGARITSAVVRADGSGLCEFVPAADNQTDEIFICLAGMVKIEGCGREAVGTTSDLEQIATAVRRKTGRIVQPDAVLRDDFVYQCRQTLDGLLRTELSGVIGEIAELLLDACPEPVDGARIHRVWEQHLLCREFENKR